MTHGICPLTMIPLRQSHAERSPLLTQVLFGDLVEVVEAKGKKWVKVRCARDGQMGWAIRRQLLSITPREYALYRTHFALVLELVHPVMGPDHMVPVTLGARLPQFDGMQFAMGDRTYTFSGQAVFPDHLQPTATLLIKLANRYLHAPALRGGRSPFGIDSGGLVQLLFGMLGIDLPADPEEQVMAGVDIDFLDQSQAGDLAFFDDAFGRIAHVGLVLPEQRVLHVYEKVRVDRLDHFGVYEDESRSYLRRLRLVKRLLAPAGTPDDKPAVESRSARQAELFSSDPLKGL